MKIIITEAQEKKLFVKLMENGIPHIGNSNKTLNKRNNDEIYTHIDEVAKEVQHYYKDLKGKIVYCNCDDEESAFFKYFHDNFHNIGLKYLHCTSMNQDGIYLGYDGHELVKRPLNGDGDCFSEECQKILQQSDIVVSNPPFSLIHQYINLILDNGKKYLIIGPVTAFQNQHLNQVLNGDFGYGYKDSNKNRMKYRNTDKTYGNHCWLTNLKGDGNKIKKRVDKEYGLDTYQTFDNSDVLYVDRGDRIPYNYDGVIAISKTYIVGMYNPYDKLLHIDTPNGEILYKIVGFGKNLSINGKEMYDRILIQKYK